MKKVSKKTLNGLYVAKIVMWLKNQPTKGFVIGVSGGIDSALVSTLCAMTEKEVHLVSMPIKQASDQLPRAQKHMAWLKKKFTNVTCHENDLTKVFYETLNAFPNVGISELATVNARSRIRMVHLYMYANNFGCMVAGTGNKVEDYGVGFFTKYGDGGVDLSPIGDLTKTEVRELATYLGVNKEIVTAKPTDGLWNDNRGDEDQIGATYPELEVAMEQFDTILSARGIFPSEANGDYKKAVSNGFKEVFGTATKRENEVFKIFIDRHFDNGHKMKMPPVCKVKGE